MYVGFGAGCEGGALGRTLVGTEGAATEASRDPASAWDETPASTIATITGVLAVAIGAVLAVVLAVVLGVAIGDGATGSLT